MAMNPTTVPPLSSAERWRHTWGARKGDWLMQSNLERLTSMLLVASAVVVVGTSSPALARRHLPERTFVTEAAVGPWSDVGGTQRWTDVSAHDASSRAEYVRSRRRG